MNKVVSQMLILVFTGLLCVQGFSQTTEFVPSGKVYARVFSNFHEGLMGEDNSSAFEITQAYFGYKYQISPFFSADVKLDIGDQEGGEYSKLKRYAYFKQAELIFKKDKFSARFGLIGMKQFNLQEDFWEKKYVKKTYLDYYRFGTSADIGAAVSYHFLPNFSVEALVMNGEGYKQLQSDNTYKGAIGLTYLPVKELTLRYYSDHSHKYVWQNSYTGFIGYQKTDLFSLAAEYTFAINQDFDDDHHWGGISVYGSYNISKQWEIFARFDQLQSDKVGNLNQAWNAATEVGPYPKSDGQYFVGGVQYIPIKNVRLSINGQYYIPAITSDNPALIGFLNCQFDF
jgi:hypothetical protein